MSSNGTYHDALEWMNSFRTLQNTKARMGPRALSNPWACLEKLGHQCGDIGKLKIIGIIVSKNHNIVSIFIESIIRKTRPGWNTGMYISSSSHQSLRERICINGKPISESLFASYFFDVWDRLSANQPGSLNVNEPSNITKISQFSTLLALHIFIRENVDATIVEIDANCSQDHLEEALNPIVIGTISHLSLSSYVWLLKQHIPLILQEQITCTVDPEFQDWDPKPTIITASPIPELADVRLGITGPEATGNATLAVHIAKTFFNAIDPYFKFAYSSSPLPSSFIVGLQKADALGLR